MIYAGCRVCLSNKTDLIDKTIESFGRNFEILSHIFSVKNEFVSNLESCKNHFFVHNLKIRAKIFINFLEFCKVFI